MISVVDEGPKGKITNVLIDRPIEGMSVETRNQWGEIRTNEALFALLAGAPMEEVKALPGEMVANVLEAQTITIHMPRYEVGEFRPAMP